MNRPSSLFFIIFISLVSITTTQSQEKKQIEIPYSGFLTFDESLPGAKILTRDDAEQVHIIHEGINLWCDKAIHYSEDKFIEAYGNVKMIQGDTINMTSKYIEYSGTTQLAFASGNVILKNPESKISSDTLYFDRIKQQAFYKSGGLVEIDSSATITSDIGLYYMKDKKYQFVDKVVLKNDSTTVKSNYFDFYDDTKHAYLFGPSTITTPDSKTYCEKGFYDTENKIGYALKNAKIYYDNRIIEGDSLYFDNNKSFASATNNIKVTDTINHSIVKGHYAEVFKEKDSLFITKRALAITVQENDSIYMHADKLTVTGKPEHRIIKGFYNAKIYKSDISAKADSIHTDQKTGLTQLINIDRFSSNDAFSTKRNPVLWNIENQMTGDTIHLISNPETEKLDSLLVFNNAFIISKDTISENGYNQINGKVLTGWFNDENTLRKVDIDKNAQSIFYARNELQELIGIDKAKSGSISMLFNNGDIEEYTRFNKTDAKMYPESKAPENELIFKGFDWREEERPNSVEDLFKDDPQLNLPIIKGLDDYIPQEDFFDEDLMERIALAGKQTNFIFSKNSSTLNKAKNLLLYKNNFDNPKWFKNGILVKANSTSDHNGNIIAENIKGVGKKDGHLGQVINYTTGNFKFSIWLKGKGTTRIRFQESGNDYTIYKNLDISLTTNWKQYHIQVNKENDGNKIRCIISNIQINDDFYISEAELIKLP